MTYRACQPRRSSGSIPVGLAAAALFGCASPGATEGGGGEGATSTGGSIAGAGTGSGSGGVAGLGGRGGSGGGAGTGGAAAIGGGAGTGGAAAIGGGAGTGGAAGRAGGGAGSAGLSGAGGASGGSAAGSGGTGASSGSDAGGTSGAGGAGGTTSTCPPAAPLSGGTRYCMNDTGNVGNGYHFELWAEGTGTGCMTVYGQQAKFSANWENVEDLLARVGLAFDWTRTHRQIGTISAEFAETKTGSDGLVYIGIYGWTDEPLREYYILDDWGATKPAGFSSDGTPRTSVGTIEVDGETYDVWMKTRVNKPAITGPSETFDQYFSIRRTARQCGRISISEHFEKWEGLGLSLGKLTEAKLLVEAQDSTGSIEFTTATVVVE
jgi:endo-1,4-beta-xylanase